MKILALADFHSTKKILSSLTKLLNEEKFDLAIIAGDLTIPGPSALNYVKSLEQIFNNANLPWQSVHGNNDPPEVFEYLKEIHRNLHFEPQTINGYRFIGIGGWGYDLPPYDLKPANSILITHIPPNIRRSPPGNLHDAPFLHLAGHIHHWAKVTDFGNTRIVNIPSAMFSRAATITLPNRNTRFINLPIINTFTK